MQAITLIMFNVKHALAGQANNGCQSIVLAGGYEDDIDSGFEFYYTGCGGRDLSGNKRTAKQSFDQVSILTITTKMLHHRVFK